MSTHLSVHTPAPFVRMSWLPPAVDRLNSPFHHRACGGCLREPGSRILAPVGRSRTRAWPAPPLEPLNLPAPLRERLLQGLLAACKRQLQRGHAADAEANAASVEALLFWSNAHDSKDFWYSLAGLERQSTIWLTWLEEVELHLALRVLLAPVSAFGVAQVWRAALARQRMLAARFARVGLLHEELARRLGNEQALARLDRALAALAETDSRSS